MKRLQYSLLGLCAIIFLVSVSTSVLADEAQGRLKAVFPDKREIVVADGAGKDLTFQLATDGKVLINNAESTLGDLEPGDAVVVVHGDQGQPQTASQIRCKRD
jgi:hypothetical protein